MPAALEGSTTAMQQLLAPEFIIFLAFVIPGFLSMRMYGLLLPGDEPSLKENVLEALAFGIANFVIMYWAIAFLIDPESSGRSRLLNYVLIVLTFFIAPLVWPVLLKLILGQLAKWNIVLYGYRNAWDDFFLRREPCWIIVHLKDGRRIGGWFGANSYAGLYPNSGYLSLEELWRLDEDGSFIEKIPQSRGVILRPEDYHFIELFQPDDVQ
jgi:hypothetical protein